MLNKKARRAISKVGKRVFSAAGTQDLEIILPVFTQSQREDEIEAEFESEDGRKIPVLKSYRYATKPGWLNYSGLAVLNALEKRGQLDDSGRAALSAFRGTRTLTVPIEEINAVAQKYIDRQPDLFITPRVSRLGKRVLRPTATEVSNRAAEEARVHKRRLSALEKYLPPADGGPRRVLEIGYISGGESLLGFEACGFEVHGIDYFYGGQFDGVQRWQYVRDLSGTKAHFHKGDITRPTGLPDRFFDVVYSSQTIEHISDLTGAFGEMHRLLKPGGLMIHAYDPYFHPMGGHSLGVLDAPYGHVRLSEGDVERYIRTFRPHEADDCIAWIRSSLNRTHCQSFVQREAQLAGFAIPLWRSIWVGDATRQLLDPPTCYDAMRHNPNIAIEDLLVKGVFFAATAI